MFVFLDVSLILLVAMFVYYGYKRGFVRAVFGFLRAVISSLLATYLSQLIAVFIYNNFLKANIAAKISQSINGNELNAGNLLLKFPWYLANILPHVGVTNQKINEVFSSSNCTECMQNLICDLLSPAYIYIIKMVCFFVLSSVFYVGFGLLSKLVYKIFDIPILSQINSTFGAVTGLLQSAAIAILLLAGMRLFLPVANNPPEIFSDDSIKKTVIFKQIYYNNPLYEPFSKFGHLGNNHHHGNRLRKVQDSFTVAMGDGAAFTL